MRVSGRGALASFFAVVVIVAVLLVACSVGAKYKDEYINGWVYGADIEAIGLYKHGRSFGAKFDSEREAFVAGYLDANYYTVKDERVYADNWGVTREGGYDEDSDIYYYYENTEDNPYRVNADEAYYTLYNNEGE